MHAPDRAGEPPLVLRWFADVDLWPCEMKWVGPTLYDLSICHVISQSWIRAQGTCPLLVGASSRESKLAVDIPFESASH